MQTGLKVGDKIKIINPNPEIKKLLGLTGTVVLMTAYDPNMQPMVTISLDRGTYAKSEYLNCYYHEISLAKYVETKLGRVLYGKRH